MRFIWPNVHMSLLIDLSSPRKAAFDCISAVYLRNSSVAASLTYWRLLGELVVVLCHQSHLFLFCLRFVQCYLVGGNCRHCFRDGRGPSMEQFCLVTLAYIDTIRWLSHRTAFAWRDPCSLLSRCYGSGGTGHSVELVPYTWDGSRRTLPIIGRTSSTSASVMRTECSIRRRKFLLIVDHGRLCEG